MTIDLPQCQEQRRGVWEDPPAQQNVSLRGPGADKNEGGEVPPQKKCQSEGGRG